MGCPQDFGQGRRARQPHVKRAPLAWGSLSRRTQLKLIRHLRQRSGRKLLGHANVVAVGTGVRYAGGVRTESHCITVMVRRKWRRPGGKRQGALPRFLHVMTKHRGKRRRVELPVDVVEASVAQIQGLGAGNCRAYFGGNNDGGTVCCLVQCDGDPTPHVLGCHHVIYLTQKRDDPAYGEVAGFSLALPNQRIGPPVDLQPVGYIDAAIVPHPAAAAGDEMIDNGIPLRGWADERADMPLACRIFTPHGVVAAKGAYLGAQQVGYYHGNGTVYTFPNIFKCEFTDGATQGGDSGSPVLDEVDRLIGMHIAGDARFSYVIPTYEILVGLPRTLTPILQL